MLRTFNCGIGMIVVAGANEAYAVTARLREAGETPVVLGEIVPRTGAATIFTGRLAL
jgi:phosphoribosylformylglycinamidine cyclo-ligase